MLVLNWFDWLVTMIIFCFALIGFSQGFVRGLIWMLISLISTVSAYFFSDSFNMNFVSKWVHSSEFAYWMSFLVIIFFVWIPGGIMHIIFGIFHKDNQPVINRLLGLFLGIVKSIVVISLILGVLSYSKVPSLSTIK